MNFPTDFKSIQNRVENFNPLPYAKTRNFGDGEVSYLSPYISRGVISTKDVYEHLKSQNYSYYHIEKFIQELAWRDYWQLVWIDKGIQINEDLKHEQQDVLHWEMPTNLDAASTGIEVIDEAINSLKETGYMHNHMRMYVAAIACNNGKSHWKLPAQWMFYYLLDGDWASNALSWQWVAGTNSNKSYIANQGNINKYFSSSQQNTFLDKSYDEIAQMECPSELKETTTPNFTVNLPSNTKIEINPNWPTLLYNEYNLDPKWRKEMEANRILLLDPNRFKNYPMGSKTIEFIIDLSKNIEELQIFTGSYAEFKKAYELGEVIYKEHPLNHDYEGQEDARDWLSSVKGYHSSFFAFWKKCKKELKF